MIGCSAKMISNALKLQQKPEMHVEENEQLLLKRIEESQNGKDSANHHLQKDQR